jgi:SAM-dependent methyltransferase
MWYLKRFEEILLYPLYLIYASLTGLPRSIKCGKCGRWLFTYWQSYRGLCENCQALWQSAGTYESSFHRGDEHIYKPIPEKVGEGRILDVGCGTGVLLARLKSERRELYGFDISPTGVRIAKTINKDTNLFVADARHMPFKSNSFDYIICTEVLEHIEGDDAIRECYRVLRANGSALFSVPNGRGSYRLGTGHVRYFTFKSFTSFLEQAGFEIISGCSWGLYIPILAPFLQGIELAFKRKENYPWLAY